MGLAPPAALVAHSDHGGSVGHPALPAAAGSRKSDSHPLSQRRARASLHGYRTPVVKQNTMQNPQSLMLLWAYSGLSSLLLSRSATPLLLKLQSTPQTPLKRKANKKTPSKFLPVSFLIEELAAFPGRTHGNMYLLALTPWDLCFLKDATETF